MEETLFVLEKIPKGTKFTKELIEINFIKKSPIQPCEIISTKIDDNLLIWFVKKNTIDSYFVIPESYLLFHGLLEMGNGIYVFDGEPKRVIVINNGLLIASFVSKSPDSFMHLISDDVGKKLSHTFLTTNDYGEIYKKGLKKISLKSLINFSKVNFSPKKLGEKIIEDYSLYALALIILYISIDFYQSKVLKSEIEKLAVRYSELKKKNSALKNKINDYNEKVRLYRKFLKNELPSSSLMDVYYNLYNNIKPEDRAILEKVEIYPGKLILVIITKDSAIKYLKRLNESPFYKDVILQKSIKMRDGNNKYIILANLERRDEKL